MTEAPEIVGGIRLAHLSRRSRKGRPCLMCAAMPPWGPHS